MGHLPSISLPLIMTDDNLPVGLQINTKKYGDIISEIYSDPLLTDAKVDLVNEIDELKNMYEEYLSDTSSAYITSMIENGYKIKNYSGNKALIEAKLSMKLKK